MNFIFIWKFSLLRPQGKVFCSQPHRKTVKAFWGGPRSNMNKICCLMSLRTDLLFSLTQHCMKLSTHSRAVWESTIDFRQGSLHVSHFLQSTVNFACFQIEKYCQLLLTIYFTSNFYMNFFLYDYFCTGK